ncbi:MAG: VOC family protein [Planctomycetota bacterium]
MTYLGTVLVTTPRMEELGAWYAAVLQLGAWERMEGYMGQKVGEVWFGFADGEAEGRGGRTVAWFHVDDVPAACDRAAAAGTTVVEPPALNEFGYELACVEDPDGNRVGLARRAATS